MPKIEVAREGKPIKKVEFKPGPDMTAKDVHPISGDAPAMDAKKKVKGIQKEKPALESAQHSGGK